MRARVSAILVSASLLVLATSGQDSQAIRTPAQSRWDLTQESVTLANGAVVLESCYRSLPENKALSLLTRLESAVLRATEVSGRCLEQFPIPDPSNVPGTLSHSIFGCEDLSGQYDGETYWLIRRGWNPTRRLFGTWNTTAHYDRQYGILLDHSATAPLVSGSIDELASLIFHEALHHFSNHRHWHNLVPSGTSGTNSIGCQNSTYEDRIYFLQAVCFPAAGHGRQFWTDLVYPGAASCPEVCQAALGEADARTRSEIRGVHGGASVLAQAIKPRQRQRACSQIQERWEKVKRVSDAAEIMQRQMDALRDSLPKKIRDGRVGSYLGLSLTLNPILGMSGAATQAQAMEKFREYERELLERADQHCRDPRELDHAEIYDFCLGRRVRIPGFLDGLKRVVLSADDEIYRAYLSQ